MRKYRNGHWLEQKYIHENKDIEEIADGEGVSTTTIKNWMDRFDIEWRQSEPHSLKRVTYYQRNGYPTIATKDGQIAVHRLAAVAWFGLDKVVDNQIHHTNEVKWDNRRENLEPLSNKEHGIKHHGDFDKPHHDPQWLKERLDEGMTQTEIAEKVGVSQPTISEKVFKYGIKEYS